MIYETAFVVKPDASEESINSLKAMLADIMKQYNAEVLINDTWGMKTFAQATESGLRKGNFFYLMYKGTGVVNTEIERKFGISEDLVRFMIIRLGEDKDQEAIVKGYRNPNQAPAASAASEDGEEEGDKEKRMHSKRKSCWFSAKKTSPDWKDPRTYGWLVNEFGKISPARVTGLTPKFQRRACDAIKRGRAMGLISYTSNEVAR